jgi:hypothetical protein
MNEGFNEPRTAIWAVAEVCWIDAAGQSLRIPATLEDTSASGVCIRLRTPISIGSNLTIKWHREQFFGIARNCRIDGREFLLGVERQGSDATIAKTATRTSARMDVKPTDVKPTLEQPQAAALATICKHTQPNKQKNSRTSPSTETAPARKHVRSASTEVCESSHRPERNVMESKGLLPKFWRRQSQSAAAQQQMPPAEPSANRQPLAAEERRATDLLSYSDIYHAAGILSPSCGYGIHKVLDMLNSDRIRDLAPEIKRASVLMAIEAAGASVDDVLQDAMRRQHALDTYESGQQKQIEEFESRKIKENSQIQAEMERITAHYADRIQRNQDQIAQEKEALRNWQMAKQHESHRIAEVMSLCMREPAQVTNVAPAVAAARAGAGSSRATALGPSLLSTAHHELDLKN